MRLVSFTSEHIPAAAALVATAARRRPLVGAVLRPERVGALLAEPALNGLGVAAVEGSRVAGFLTPLDCRLWGAEAAFTAEWGWAAGEDGPGALYAAASPRWGESGRRLHAVTVWADESNMEQAWHHLGFGRVVVDAVRDLRPVELPAGDVAVRRAGPEDAAAVVSFEQALWDYLAVPPVCRPPGPSPGRPAVAERLADPRQPIWLAEAEGPVGFLSLRADGGGPAALCAPGCVRCDGAFVEARARRRGAGAALIGAALQWARDAGFGSCSLDFESANPAASGFWPRVGFRPVLHTLVRRTA